MERNGGGRAVVSSVYSDIVLGGLLEQLLELFFLNPVVARSDRHYNGYCHKDGGAFHPSGLPTVLHHADHEGAGGGEEKNS